MEKQIEEAKKELEQIDEIAKLICNYPQCINYNIIGGCKIAECNTVDIAKNLYKQGYRKQVQGKWLEVRTVRYNGTKPYTQIAHQCSNCKWLNKHSKGWNTNYCPNCSAKMKGN